MPRRIWANQIHPFWSSANIWPGLQAAQPPLRMTCPDFCVRGDVLGGSPDPWTFAGLLRQIIQPYLGEGNADLAFTAEVVGISKRTLQRQSQASGSSYSEIQREARFKRARSLLDNPTAKVIDFAMASGYESPSTSPTPFDASQVSFRLSIAVSLPEPAVLGRDPQPCRRHLCSKPALFERK